MAITVTRTTTITNIDSTGGRMVFLNNQHERPATSRNGRDDIVRFLWKHKVNTMRPLWSGIKDI